MHRALKFLATLAPTIFGPTSVATLTIVTLTLIAILTFGCAQAAAQSPDVSQSPQQNQDAGSPADAETAPSKEQKPAQEQTQAEEQGQAPETHAPEGQAPEAQEPQPKEPEPHWKIAVENWTKPERGWLYVLDPQPDGGGPGWSIRLIEPESGKTKGSIRTGESADFALLPDGSRLYVASFIEGDTSELAVIDTAKGTVLQRALIDYREMGGMLPAFPTMAVSGDGLALRILIDTPKPDDPDHDSFLLATFDTRTGEFLRRSVHLGNCGPVRFISHATADRFDVQCPRSNRVRMIRVDGDSRELQNVDVVMPWERRVGVAEAIKEPGADDISIVRGDGTVVEMSVATQKFGETAEHPNVPNRVPPAAWPVSPDGGKLYLGYNNAFDHNFDNHFYLEYGRAPNVRPATGTAAEFRVFDTHTWRKIGTIKTKQHFWSAVLGNDGKTLYATVPQRHSILVIDTEKMHETGILNVGGAPTLALVAP
jgi:hypothetical protein